MSVSMWFSWLSFFLVLAAIVVYFLRTPAKQYVAPNTIDGSMNHF